MTGLQALRANLRLQVGGLIALSMLAAVGLALGSTERFHLSDGGYTVLVLLACGTMLTAFVLVGQHRLSSRVRGALLGVGAYLVLGFVYGVLRYAITQERSFLIGMSMITWPWFVVEDVGCVLGLWDCLSLGR